MLPTSRRDRYDNAKRRRGGILKTLLRKEARLIRQLLVFLFFVAALLLALWLLPRGRLLQLSSPSIGSQNADPLLKSSQSKIDKTDPLSKSSLSKIDKTDPLSGSLLSETDKTALQNNEPDLQKEKPKQSKEGMPRLSLGGKRFLPVVEEEGSISVERVVELEVLKTESIAKESGAQESSAKESGQKGSLDKDAEIDDHQNKKGNQGKREGLQTDDHQNKKGNQVKDSKATVLTAGVLSLDAEHGPWTAHQEETGTAKPRKEAKNEQLADLLSELDGVQDLEKQEEGSGSDAGGVESKEEVLTGRKVESREGRDESGGETKAQQLQKDGGRAKGVDQNGRTSISDTGGLIRTGAEGGGMDASGNQDASGSASKREQKTEDELGSVIKSPSEEEVPEPSSDTEEDPPARVIKSPSKGASSHSAEWDEKRQLVAAAFENAWGAYRKHAWGHDELRPVSQQGEDGLGGLGATIVDALDTAMIMGLGDVVSDAGNWIDRELPGRLASQGYVNLFETTIRVLGGLLSAYHLSGGGGADLTLAGGAARAQGRGPPPEVYLKRAEDLAGRLMSAFSSPTPVPFSDVHLANKEGKPAQFDGGSSSTAEVATLGMEFCYLSKLTDDPRYCDAALGVVKHIQKQNSVDGLVPIFINPHSGHFDGNNIRLGSRGDSYYEYLIKVWMQRGGAKAGNASDVRWLREMWDESMAGVKSRLVGSSVPSGLLFVGERPDGLRAALSSKMDHLVCFLGGSLALGATKGRTLEEAMSAGDFSDVDKEDLRIARELTRSCYAMYDVTLTGLAPEIAYFNTGGGVNGMPPGNPKSKYLEDIVIQPLDRHNLLRPETVESLFVLHRITGDDEYRQWGWEIFKSLEAHARVESGGYSSLHDVTKIPAPKRDKMETFFLGETLKYLYLLFSDSDVLPLDRYVFNTEAHPLPIWESSVETMSRHQNPKHEATF